MGWTIGWSGFDSQEELGIFLFDTMSTPALEPTQPPIQWVPGAISLGVKRPGREANRSSSVAIKECVELYLHSPNTCSLRGAYLCTETTLAFTLRIHMHTHKFPIINYFVCRGILNYILVSTMFITHCLHYCCRMILYVTFQSNSMELCPSWNANSHSARQEIYRLRIRRPITVFIIAC
jgi:hypothetical protein